MVSRVSAAACAAALVAMLAAPVQSNARGGGGAMGRGGGFHPPVSSFHPPVRSFHHVHPPFAHAHRAPLVRHEFARSHAFHAAARRHHRAALGLADLGGYWGPVTSSDNGTFYGSYYDPSDMIRPFDPPAYRVPPAAVVPVAAREAYVDRGGCRSETVTLQSPGSADRSITITRC